MGTPLFRPVRNVNPKSGLTKPAKAGSMAKLVSDQYHSWRSRLRGDAQFEASRCNFTPRIK